MELINFQHEVLCSRNEHCSFDDVTNDDGLHVE